MVVVRSLIIVLLMAEQEICKIDFKCMAKRNVDSVARKRNRRQSVVGHLPIAQHVKNKGATR